MSSVSEKDFALQPVERIIDQVRIAQRVAELGGQITRDYASHPPVLVGVLKGCAVFMADLMRHIDLPLEIDFVTASSYRRGTKQAEKLEADTMLTTNIKGRHVLIVEGIVETGRTARKILEDLQQQEPASVEVVTLLDKPASHRSQVVPKYKGFSIGNEFVVGYGLDNTQKYRNLPFIGRVVESR